MHLPSASCNGLCVPMTSSGSAKPLSKTRSERVTSADVESAWNFFPKGENPIFYNGMRLSSLGHGISGLTLLEPILILLREEERKRGNSPKAAALPDTLSHVCCQVTPWRSCGHHSLSLPDGSRMEQKPETVLKSQEHPKRETRDKTKVQKR